jgi:ubiquinone/menaquinone biosynthesis C-methylase UbiE
MVTYKGSGMMARMLVAGCLALGVAASAAARDFRFLADPGTPAAAFPGPDRPVAEIMSPIWSTEAERDAAHESSQLARLLGIVPGMTVGDIGAGSGYHTVRLSPVVGPSGRIIAQDVTPRYLADLARRVGDLRLGNVTLALGEQHDPRLPPGSLDVALMVRMYHHITQPYAFLYNLAPALKPGARVGIVDLDAKTSEMGTPPDLLRCELAAVGYREITFHKLEASPVYLAVFAPPARANRTPPGAIVPCRMQER